MTRTTIIRVAAQQVADKIKAVMLAHAERVTAWQASQSGGTDEVRVAKAVLDYLVKVHGFLTQDGEGFVVKLENIDVKVKNPKVIIQDVTGLKVANVKINGVPYVPGKSGTEK